MCLCVLMIFSNILGLTSWEKNRKLLTSLKSCAKDWKNEKIVNIGKIVRIRSDHGKEFENAVFSDYCDKHGIAYEFSAHKTPQQNGVVERKNKTLQKMARVMINSKKLSTRLWVEAINTACYTINRVYL